MKKVLIIFIAIVSLVFLSDKIYQIYSSTNINSHESVVLINNQLTEYEIDSFFNLKEGTYNSKEHKIVFSIIKKDGYLLDKYISLPVKYKTKLPNKNSFDCNSEYEKVRVYRFYDYEINNRNIVARIIIKKASAIKQLNSKQIISEKQLRGNYEFGKLNILDITKDGLTKHCK